MKKEKTTTQSLRERVVEVMENGPEPKDIPLMALLIFAAISVIGGEIICCIAALVIPMIALFSASASKLLMLIPCALLISVFTAIILVFRREYFE